MLDIYPILLQKTYEKRLTNSTNVIYLEYQESGEPRRKGKMQDILMRCFYDGMSKDEAVAFIESAYGVLVKPVSINMAIKKIKTQTGKDW